MTGPRSSSRRRRRSDPAEATRGELAELAARASALREATAAAAPMPAEADHLEPLARSAARDLHAVARRLAERARELSPAAVTLRCARCGRPLPAHNPNRRWCSHACRQRAYEERQRWEKP